MKLVGRTDTEGHLISEKDEEALISHLGKLITLPVAKGADIGAASLEGVAALWLPSIVGQYSILTVAVSIIAAIELYAQISGYWGLWNLYVLTPYLYILIQLVKTWGRIEDKINTDFCNDAALMGMWETHKRML